jgi:hypothetical protein
MPYTPSTVPDYVPKAKAAQFAAVWNSVYKKCIASGGSKKECETKAFRQANGVIKKSNERVARIGDWEVRIIGSA